MKIDYLSDLHIDHWIKQNNPQHPKFKKGVEDYINMILNKNDLGDVFIIAGDLSNNNIHSKYILKLLKEYYKNILIVSGNHDKYLTSNSQVSKYKALSSNRENELKEICLECDIHFLDGNVIEIDGIKFGGTCSWYNLPEYRDIQAWKNIMNDSRYIYEGYKVQPYGMYQSYSQSSTNWDTQKFWESEKSKLIQIAEEGCDVFITHVALNEPTVAEGMNPEFNNDTYNIFYYTDNIELLKKSGCSIAIHGHTHQHLDYKKEGIRIVCNTLGYPSEQKNGSIKQIEI